MTAASSTSRIRPVQAKNPKITHVPVGTTEVDFQFEQNAKKILIQNHTTGYIRYSYSLGGTGVSADEWIEIPCLCSISIDGIDYSGKIYLISENLGQTIRIEQWS